VRDGAGRLEFSRWLLTDRCGAGKKTHGLGLNRAAADRCGIAGWATMLMGGTVRR
jgi:hypothetical protein